MFYFLLAATMSAGLGYPVMALLRRFNFIDNPNSRSSHSKPTVRGGGVSIMVPILVLGIWTTLGPSHAPTLILMGAALLIAVVSFIDDFRSLSPAKRFGCHSLAACLAVFSCRGDQMVLGYFDGGFAPLLAVLSAILSFFWIAGYTNAYNFMDGINGIAGGQAVVTGLGTALLGGMVSNNWISPFTIMSFIVAGAATGFLLHNFPKASMFMGDVGSAPLGFLLASLALGTAALHGWWLLIPLAILHANFVLDTGLTFMRRLWRGEKWYLAHREHFYQRLMRSGKSHVFVTSCEMGMQLFVLGAMITYIYATLQLRIALVTVVVLAWAFFFVYSEIRFRINQSVTL